MAIIIGAGSDAWGIWHAEHPSQIPWQRYLDEVAEAGYRVVEPGNFGRMIRRYRRDQFGDGWRMARELLFEQARQDFATSAPSRLNACFMCPIPRIAIDLAMLQMR